MKEWIHPEVGRVVLQKNSRSKRLVLRVNSADQVRVTLPKLYPYWMAKKMVIQQLDWIKKQQKKTTS
jgi:predicted metal-dependent hydrolase